MPPALLCCSRARALQSALLSDRSESIPILEDEVKNRTIALAGLGILSVVAAFVTKPAGAYAQAGKSYAIAAKYTAGETLAYKMTTNMTTAMTAANGQNSPMPGGDVNMTMGLKMKTQKVAPNGDATIVTTIEGGDMTAMGQTMKMPATPPITTTIDKHGVTKKVSGTEKVPGGEMMSQMFNFNSMPSSGVFYPDHAVKIGEVWSASLPGMMGKKKMHVTSKLLSVAKGNGADVYTVKQTWTIPMEMYIGKGGQPTKSAAGAMMAMTGVFVSAGNVKLRADTGRIISMIATVKGSMAMVMKGEAATQSPFGSKMNMKITGKTTMTTAPE